MSPRPAALALLTLLAALPAPSRSATAQSRDREAPARYAHVIGRASGETPWLYSNLRYESNNRSMRGAFDPRPESGCDNAGRQRALAARTRGLYVLRDALFSQQDHPVEHRACAIMLPANWITAAVDDATAGRACVPVARPPLEDDAAWARLATERALFGSFPPSARLFETARRPMAGATPEARAETSNARANVHALGLEAEAMMRGNTTPAAIAAAGAERIAASDRAYFTERVRHDHVIVLAVENPSEHELIDEAKGVAIHGRAVPESVLTLVRDAVYRRRLLDGELALERYDLTIPAERSRVLRVLEALVPPGTTGHRVHIWVGGGLIEGTETVRDATAQLPTFRRELAAAAVAHERVVVVNRPSFRLGRRSAADLEREVDRFRAWGLPLSVQASPGALRRVFEPAP